MPFKIDIQNIPNRIKNCVRTMTDKKLIFWVLLSKT